MSKIAIVTGATGGIGRKFIEKISPLDEIEEIWAVGRNRAKLEELGSIFPKVVPFTTDLANQGISEIVSKLKSEKPNVRILINNAGAAYMGAFESMEEEKAEEICRINCMVPAILMRAVLPFMEKGGRILNISSASSFQPNPYLALYSASKVFLKNLSRRFQPNLKDAESP